MISLSDFIFVLDRKLELLDDSKNIEVHTLQSGNLALVKDGSIISIFNFDTNTFKDI